MPGTTVPPRLPDWRSRLSRYFTEVARRPLVYGQHDCALFAAGAVAAMTGVDPAAPFRGAYSSIDEGLALLLEAGVEAGEEDPDLVGFLRRRFAPVALAFAGVGDLAVLTVPGSNVPALGVIEGQHVAVLHEDGMGFVPRETAVLAFRVP